MTDEVLIVKPEHSLTELLVALRTKSGDSEELQSQVYQQAYPQLQAIASRLMNLERANHTLRPTALIHEAYLVLVNQSRTDWQCRAHFLSVAARVMRRVLVDHARGHLAEKRGGGARRVTLDVEIAAPHIDTLNILVLDDALNELAALQERVAQVVVERVFGGMTAEETAVSVGVSVRTVMNDWEFARRWLARYLGP